jgi:hypothetical protein
MPAISAVGKYGRGGNLVTVRYLGMNKDVLGNGKRE